MCCSSFDPIIEGLERNQFLICVLDWGLERICLTNLMFLILEGNLFPSRLTRGLERSLFASIFDCIFDSVGIILSSCDAYAIYHRGLEMSWLVSVLLVSFLCVGWGLERNVSACFPGDLYAVNTKGLEMSQLMSVWLISVSCVNWGLERSTHFFNDSYAIYTKGLERSQLLLLSPALCVFGWGLERSFGAHACSHGLERTGWMVLKGLWCNSLVPPQCFAV